MALLKVDVDQLTALGSVLDDVGSQIDGIEIRSAVADISAALPGCPIGATCATAGESTEYAWLKVAERFRAVSSMVKFTATDIHATDVIFKQRLETMAFQDRGDGA